MLESVDFCQIRFNSKRYDYRIACQIPAPCNGRVSIPNGTITGMLLTAFAVGIKSFNSKRYDYRFVDHLHTFVDKKVSIPNGTITGRF